MGLVDYSDDSEDETPNQPKDVQTPPVSSSQKSHAPRDTKSTFHKVVNKDNKIKVSLPDGSTSQDDDSHNEERPNKRAKISGAFSGFGSLLPAPKNASATKPSSKAGAEGSILARNRGQGLARGVSLKTGATPGFSRRSMWEAEEEQSEEKSSKVGETVGANQSDLNSITEDKHNRKYLSSDAEPKLVGKATMFKPLSVSRKPKKKPPATATQTISIGTGSDPTKENMETRDKANSGRKMSKPKVSLFSTTPDEPTLDTAESSGGDYQPILEEEGVEDGRENMTDNPNGIGTPAGQDEQTGVLARERHSDLSILADSLGMSAAQKRQLFGRGGQPTDAQIAHINMSQEYEHNNEMRENEAMMPNHNPVRSIAPGKHSLQQLVNAAQSNKDALEESFARGKANKKDAGSRYGW